MANYDDLQEVALDKRPRLYSLIAVIWCVGLALFLASCTVKPEPMTMDEQIVSIEHDLANVFAEQKPAKKPLSLYQAIARAVQNNLEQRLQAYELNIDKKNIDIEQLKMLPELNVGYGAVHRSNDPLITFRAADDGSQALETVGFDDKSKQIANLELSWNILDFGLSYARARQHADQYLIGTERRRKILQGLIQETRIAYFKAAAAEKIMGETDDLIGRAKEHLDRARHLEQSGLQTPDDILEYQASLLENIRELVEKRKRLIDAKIELAHLVNLPIHQDYALDFNEKALQEDLPNFDLAMEDLQLFSLMNRPEIREEFYNERIAESRISQEIANTFPGIGLSVGGHYDSNSFLENTKWLTLATGFAGNLMKIFTLGDRVAKAELQEKLVELRRQALMAAVISQVKMSYARYKLAKDDYLLYSNLAGVNERLIKKEEAKLKTDTISPAAYIHSNTRYLMNKVAQYYAYIDLHSQYARLVTTMGIDLLPRGYASMDTDKLALEIEKRFGALDHETIAPMMDKMRARANELRRLSHQQSRPEAPAMKAIEEQDNQSPNQINPAPEEPAQPLKIAPLAYIGIMEGE